MPKRKSILIIIIVVSIIAGFILGQIPIFDNQAEQHEELQRHLEGSANRAIELVLVADAGIHYGDSETAVKLSLFCSEAIFLLRSDWIEMSYSEEDRQLLCEFAKYIKIIYDDLSMIKDNDEFFNSDAYEFHNNFSDIYKVEAYKDRPMNSESPNQGWTHTQGLLDMLKSNLGKELFAEFEQYMIEHRNYDPYEDLSLN